MLNLIKIFNMTVSFFFVHSRNGYFQYLLCSKGCNFKSRLTRVTVFVLRRCLMVLCEFMCSASRFVVLYISVKFCKNTPRTPVHSRNRYFQYLLCSKGCNFKSRLTRVTVFVFCMLSHGALYL